MPTPSRRHLCFVFLLFAMAWGFTSHSQPSTVRFRHLSVEQGLSSTQVTSIVQDGEGFMWFGTWKGLNRYDGYGFEVFRHNPKDSLSLGDDGVYALLADRKGSLWAGTSTGLDRFDRATGTFSHFVFEKNGLGPTDQNNNVFRLFEDREGKIWATCRYGLNRLDPASGKVTSFWHDPSDPSSLGPGFVTSICQAQDGTIWAGTPNGLNRLDLAAGTCRRFVADPENPASPASISSNGIFKIVEAEGGLLHIWTSAGLDICDPRSPAPVFQHRPGEQLPALVDRRDGSRWSITASGLRRQLPGSAAGAEEFRHTPGNPDGLCSNEINKLYQDTEGNIWVGTDNGISLLTPDALRFRHFKNDPDDPNSLSHNVVLSVIEGRDGAVWLGTMGGGLNRLDPKTGNVKRYPFDAAGTPHATNSGQIFRIIEDHRGTLWVGLADRGLDRLDRSTGVFSHQRWNDIRDMVSFFYEDKDSVLWIGHQGGVSRFNRPSGNFEFSHYAPEAKGRGGLGVVTGILEDHTGTWWVCSNGYYLNRFDPRTMQYQRYLPDPKKPGSIRSDNIQAIYEDRKGQLWVAAINGLDLFDRATQTFTHFGLEDGLPDLVMGHPLEDGAGRLWIATGKGITRFDPETRRFRNFDKTDGLSSNESWDFVKSPSTGAFLLATANGLTIFHPDSLRENQAAPPIVFTKCSRYNSQEDRELAVNGPAGNAELTFSHADDILTFEFAALSFRKPSKNQYAYRLEGFNDQWIPLGTKREVSFTNLDPGTYTLRVKGSNGDGVWNEAGASLKFTVTPPWWATWWAKFLYIALIMSGLYYAYRSQLRLKLKHAEAERLMELDALRTRLYTNITHEFRTPLTIISGMADQIHERPEEWLEEGTQLIKRNSNQLLQLVNQMLDLSKLESGKMPLHFVQGDVVGFLRYIVESFHSLAEAKNVHLTMQTDLPEFFMDYDEEKLQQIVSNLLSNAIKFTPEGGQVDLRFAIDDLRLPGTDSTISNRKSQIVIRDTGIGIPPEKLSRIFDRFYQVDDKAVHHADGTGIGLTLTKELVKLLGGSISVESQEGMGTTFKVGLPVTNRAGSSRPKAGTNDDLRLIRSALPNLKSTIENQLSVVNRQSSLAHLLLIEDNPDVVRYLAACLEKDYRLDMARNGREGVEKALETVPDLVISDVMMPEMDGFEVCKTLKNDERTSHIPIILLTAKADLASKIEGLERGADAYLAKPFEKDELLVRVRKLLELRQRLQQHYLSLTTSSVGEVLPPETNATESAFVQKVRDIVETHLDDAQFDLARFSRELTMSPSQLHRKLVALTGLSPNRFIRHVRLKKAQTLLLETEGTVSSIAYEAGFNDPDYFIRAFRQEFGETPMGFRKKNHTKK